MSRLAGVLALFVLLLAGAVQAAPQFPPLTGRVVDDAHVLSPQIQADLTDKLAALEAKTSRQLVVVTLPSLNGYAIEDYGYQLLRAWGIGQKATNNGALFIIVPSEHQVRIEVGYGLEPILTDALSSVILQRSVLPKFRGGDVSGGIVDGTNEIITQLGADPSTAEAKAAQAEQTEQAPSRGGFPIRALFPLLFIGLFLFSSIFRGRGGGGLGWFLPMMFLSGGMGGRGWERRHGRRRRLWRRLLRRRRLWGSGGGASGGW